EPFERHLAHDHGLDVHPLGIAAGAPSAGATGGAAYVEARASLERREGGADLSTLGRLERRRVPDVLQDPAVVVEAEQEAPDAVVVLRDPVATHHAVDTATVLHLHPAALAGQVRLVGALGDEPVLPDPGVLSEPTLRRRYIVGPRREQ